METRASAGHMIHQRASFGPSLMGCSSSAEREIHAEGGNHQDQDGREQQLRSVAAGFVDLFVREQPLDADKAEDGNDNQRKASEDEGKPLLAAGRP